jgi:hypothetical protein
LIAASYCARVTPAGSFGAPLLPPPRKPPPGGRLPPLARLGNVMPFFCRHSRSAAKRLLPAAPAGLPVVVLVELALVLVLVEEPFVEELPPHAARQRLASITRTKAATVGLGRRLLLMN